MEYRKFVLFIVINWLTINDKLIVECSGMPQKSEGFWGALTKAAASIFNGKASVDSTPNYAKLYEFENNLKKKFEAMTKSIDNNPNILGIDPNNHVIIKYSEASAFSAISIRDIVAHLDTWMDLVESKKVRDGFKILSKHILWIRSTGTIASTNYFIYRPSYEDELDSSDFLPHLKYHSEAEKTADVVVDVVKMYPNDQIIFVGLQSGGAVAMLHSWIVAASVPIVHRNLVRFKGELHQIKVFTFDSDCLLSKTHGKSYPIPSWDVLKFYSGYSSGISGDFCRFDSMEPGVGLAYNYNLSALDYISSFGLSKLNVVDRTAFLDYYLTPEAVSEYDNEAIDNGLVDNNQFDDNASLADSDISASIAEGYRIRTPLTHHLRPTRTVEELITPGIDLLTKSIRLTKLFFTYIKNIYNGHNVNYLRRNVNECAAAMEEKLTSSLLGTMPTTLVLDRDVDRITCKVKSYNEKTKLASIICSLIGRGGGGKATGELSTFKFKNHLRNDMDQVLEANQVITLENKEVRTVRSISANEASFNQQLPRRGRYDHDGSFDDRSVVTSAEIQGGKASQWHECLSTLFARSSHLSFINPSGVDHGNHIIGLPSAAHQKVVPGESEIQIKLPFSSSNGLCQYSLESKPKNFHQLYLVNPNMFYSIFTELIKPDNSFPEVCHMILEPPKIPYKHYGNAGSFSSILKNYFNSDGISQISPKNIIVNGLEINESFTNLPSNSPYDVFNPVLSGKLAECLSGNVLERMYDCSSHLTLWAGKHHCPDVCIFQDGGKAPHLCSRVINCGEGVFFGFRGGKTFDLKILGGGFFVKEPTLKEEFTPRVILGRVTEPAYFAAFHLKYVDTLSDAIKNPLRFAVFLSNEAKRNFIDVSSAVSGNASVAGKTGNMQNDRIDNREINVSMKYGGSVGSVHSATTLQRKTVSNYIRSSTSRQEDDLSDFEDDFSELRKQPIGTGRRPSEEFEEVSREQGELYEDSQIYDYYSGEEMTDNTVAFGLAYREHEEEEYSQLYPQSPSQQQLVSSSVEVVEHQVEEEQALRQDDEQAAVLIQPDQPPFTFILEASVEHSSEQSPLTIPAAFTFGDQSKTTTNNNSKKKKNKK